MRPPRSRCQPAFIPAVPLLSMETYSLGCTIPSLDEIVGAAPIANCGPYTREAFTAYLCQTHCVENYEIVQSLDQLLVKRRHWPSIYAEFIEPDSEKEVNIPHKLRDTLHPDVEPSRAELLLLRNVVFELLLDNYNEFVLHTRERTNDTTTQRRRLELVPPEIGTPAAPQPQLRPPPKLRSPHELKQQWDDALVEHEAKDNVRIATRPSDALERSRTGSAGTTFLRSLRALLGSWVESLRSWPMRKLRLGRLGLA